MGFRTWYFGKMRDSKKFRTTMAVLIAPIVYTAGVGAVFVQLFKNIWTCLVDCWYSIGATVGDINRYYRDQVFEMPIKPKKSDPDDEFWGVM